MRVKPLLLAAAAVMALGTTAAVAENLPDPDGYYSRSDPNGYYDHNGQYHHVDSTGDRGGDVDSDRDRNGDVNSDADRDHGDEDADRDRGYPDDGDSGPPPVPYREGEYERDCRSGNAAGTVFGAAGGGLIGGVASHGNPAAIVGGVLLGGLLGNALSRDVDCDDQHVAFDVYAEGLNGDIGRRYEWRHGESYGYFTPTREYTEDGRRCREFTTDTWHHGQEFRRDGTACYGPDGYWHFR